jgi:putative membrane protein
LEIAQVYRFAPYCGAPPGPETWLGRWNLDPILIGFLLAILIAYLFDNWASGPSRWRRAAFYCGWTIGALALVSPLCPLSVALFSARVGQHMLLVALAAPLIALGEPGAILRRRLARALPADTPARPVAAAATLAVALWVWHAPAPYAATFQNDLTYWAMHVTTFGAALWFWTELLHASRGSLGGFAAATLLTTGQMGLLGALITFAGRPLYAPHALTTYAWGLTPLQDQQFGGALMWVPAGVIFAGGFAFAFVHVLRRAEARSSGNALA